MGFQVEPQHIAPRRSVLPGIVAAIAGLAIVAVGLVTAGGSAPSPKPAAGRPLSRPPDIRAWIIRWRG